MSRCTFFGVFFSAVKKDTENCAPGNFFGPSYFVTTLVSTLIIESKLITAKQILKLNKKTKRICMIILEVKVLKTLITICKIIIAVIFIT